MLYHLESLIHLHTALLYWGRAEVWPFFYLFSLFYGRIGRIYIPIFFSQLSLGFVGLQISLFFVGVGGSFCFVDFGGKGAFSQITLYFFLFLFNFFLYFLLLPQIDSVQEVGFAVEEIAFVLFEYGLKGALSVYFVFAVVMLFDELFF